MAGRSRARIPKACKGQPEARSRWSHCRSAGPTRACKKGERASRSRSPTATLRARVRPDVPPRPGRRPRHACSCSPVGDAADVLDAEHASSRWTSSTSARTARRGLDQPQRPAAGRDAAHRRRGQRSSCWSWPPAAPRRSACCPATGCCTGPCRVADGDDPRAARRLRPCSEGAGQFSTLNGPYFHKRRPTARPGRAGVLRPAAPRQRHRPGPRRHAVGLHRRPAGHARWAAARGRWR